MLTTLMSLSNKRPKTKFSGEVVVDCVKYIMYRQKSCDLATNTNFLVTRRQPEMLHISHYEWLHLTPEYLTQQHIRLQITGELLNSINYRKWVWCILLWGRQTATFTETGMCKLLLYDLGFINLWKPIWILNSCRWLDGHVSSVYVAAGYME